jgi:hypothetical protein
MAARGAPPPPTAHRPCERAAMGFAQSPRGCSIKQINACLVAKLPNIISPERLDNCKDVTSGMSGEP